MVAIVSRGVRVVPDEKQEPSSPKQRTFLPSLAICVFLLAAVAAVFGQTLRYDFIKDYDDNHYVTENRHVTEGLGGAGIAWAFTTFHATNWHPLTWLSHMLDCQFYELWPGGHHLSSVLLHAATAVLLFLLLRRMTGALWPSALAAAVFAVHPLRVESVAWIAERKDVLSGLFFVLTLWAYVAYAGRPWSWFRYSLVVLLYALGLMAKPMLVTLPFLLLLLDYWPLGRFAPAAKGAAGAGPAATARRLGWLLLEKVPLLALAAASCVVTLLAQARGHDGMDLLPMSDRAANAVVSMAAYLGNFFYPAGLTILYRHPGSWPRWEVAAAAAVLAIITAAAILCWRKCPYLIVGWLWYLGMLVPVLGLVQVGSQAMADRYTYLPMIGVTIALAWLLASAAENWRWGGPVFGAAAALAVAVLMGCAWQQTSYWRNSETLWDHHQDVCPSETEGDGLY